MFLDSTTKSLEVVLSAASTTNPMVITVDYVDMTATTTVAGSYDSQTNGTATVTILTAPAASTQRKVNGITIYNGDTVAGTITVRLNNAGILRGLVYTTIQVSNTLGYTDTSGWYSQDATGSTKITGGASSITGTPNQITASASTGAVTLSLTNPINVNTTGSAAIATSLTGIGNAAAFDSRYTLSGADGSSANFVTVVLPVTLTVAESGKTIGTNASGTITLPAPIQGLNYRILGNGNGAVTINLTAPAANIYFPDTSTASSFTLPTNWHEIVSLYCDGTNWVMYDMNGRTIVANAVNPNEAVALGQINTVGTWTPVLNGFTITGTPSISGNYIQIGKMVTVNFVIYGYTSIASTLTTSYISGLPGISIRDGFICNFTLAYTGIASGILVANHMFPPSFGPTSGVFYGQLTYFVN